MDYVYYLRTHVDIPVAVLSLVGMRAAFWYTSGCLYPGAGSPDGLSLNIVVLGIPKVSAMFSKEASG